MLDSAPKEKLAYWHHYSVGIGMTRKLTLNEPNCILCDDCSPHSSQFIETILCMLTSPCETLQPHTREQSHLEDVWLSWLYWKEEGFWAKQKKLFLLKSPNVSVWYQMEVDGQLDVIQTPSLLFQVGFLFSTLTFFGYKDAAKVSTASTKLHLTLFKNSSNTTQTMI